VHQIIFMAAFIAAREYWASSCRRTTKRELPNKRVAITNREANENTNRTSEDTALVATSDAGTVVFDGADSDRDGSWNR